MDQSWSLWAKEYHHGLKYISPTHSTLQPHILEARIRRDGHVLYNSNCTNMKDGSSLLIRRSIGIFGHFEFFLCAQSKRNLKIWWFTHHEKNGVLTTISKILYRV